MRNFFAYILLVAVVFTSAAADDRRAQLVFNEDSLLNLSAEELNRQLGKPDNRIVAGDREEWRYGNSIIFLTKNRVHAWSDSGDLANRRLISGLRGGDKASIELVGWRNAWEVEPPVTADDVILELINRR